MKYIVKETGDVILYATHYSPNNSKRKYRWSANRKKAKLFRDEQMLELPQSCRWEEYRAPEDVRDKINPDRYRGRIKVYKSTFVKKNGITDSYEIEEVWVKPEFRNHFHFDTEVEARNDLILSRQNRLDKLMSAIADAQIELAMSRELSDRKKKVLRSEVEMYIIQ